MKKKGFIILALVLFLTIIFNWSKFIGFMWALELNSDKVKITKRYIKPGWMTKGSSAGKLAIQEIQLDSVYTTESLTYSVFEEKSRVKDSCVVYFGEGDLRKICFNKEYDWTWDFYCSKVKVYSKKRFGFLKENSFYRIARKIFFYSGKEYIYIYVDNDGEVYKYEASVNF